MKRQIIVCIILFVALASSRAPAYTSTVGSYTWTYFPDSKGGGVSISKVSPSPTGSVTVPSSLGSYQVTTIDFHAFANCSGMTGVIIPNGVKTIELESFDGCSGLTRVSVSASVTSISELAFRGCSRLTSFSVSDDNSTYKSVSGMILTKDGKTLALVPKGLKSTTIPKGVTHIGDEAFYECSGITTISIPNSVTSIGGGAFRSCTGLKSIVIPVGVTTIGERAFIGCSSLKSITIPNSVTSIGSRSFYGCASLTNATIQNCLTTIGSSAFPDGIPITKNHVEFVIPSSSPTCTEDGRTEEVFCTKCNETLVESTTLPKLGGSHTGAVTKPAVEPTSGSAGKTAEITCTRCRTVLQAQETIPALGYIRNVTAAQLWPHRKIAFQYELAPDIADAASPNTAITVKGTYGSTTKTATQLLGDASCTPGLHHIVWNVEGDSITHTQKSMSFTLSYASASANASCWVALSSAVKDGMSIDGTRKNLWFSPFGDGEVQLLVDGNVFISSTNLDVFAWTPQTTGSHTLVHKSGSYTWTRTLNVTSLAWATDPVPNPPTAEDPNISISSTSKSFAVGGGSGSIVTSGSGTWTATASDDWITIPSALSSRNAGLPVVYQVTTNSGVEPRTGYIYVSGHVFTVTQAGVGAALDSTSASFETEGGTGSFTVLADAQTSWMAKPDVDWISVAATSGTGEDSISYTVAPFNEVSTRSGTITAAGCTFTVNQTGRRMKIAGGTIVSSVSGLTADYDYQSHVVDIQVNALVSTVWDVEPEASWISVVDAGSGRGGDNVALAINENPSYLARSGMVRIGTETLTIHQTGRPASALSFSISPTKSTASVKGANAIVSVTATPDLPWTATSQANWITVMPTFQNGAGNGNVIYSASPNPTMSARSGTIKVSPEVGSRKTHTVSQPAATSMVSAMSHTFAATGESFPVEVTVDDVVNWTVSSSASWVVAQGDASRYGPGTVTVAASENLTVEPREANLTIAGYTFHAVQRGRSVQVEYETRVFGTETDYATLDVHPDGNVTWTAVSSDPSWLTIWGGEGCTTDADGNVVGTGDNTIEYIVADYVGDGMPRTATITIGDKTVYITQRGYDLSINPTGTRVSGNAGSGTVGVSASVGEVWNAIATEPWITITSGYSEGSGSGTVRFTYADNNTGEERTGKIVIAGEAYTVTQAARQMVTVSSRIEGGKGVVGGGGTYDRGTTITLTAIAQDGYEFLNWGLPNGSTATAASLTVTADVDKEIVANFRRIPYYGVNGESVREGTSVSFTPPADIVDAAGTTKLVCLGTSRYPDKGTSFTLVVTEDIEFEWDRWTTNYLVTVTQPSGGKIKKGSSQAPATSWVAAGSSLTLKAAPNSGKSLFRWSVTGSTIPVESSDASLTLRVDAPLTVSAVFGTFGDTLATAVDAPLLVFATGGDADWTPVIDATAQTGYTSARSGAGGADTDTWLDTTVEGTGTFSFRWRVDCEKDDGGEATWDRLAVFTNGVEAARIDGTTAWQTVTLPISGKTTIRWSFYRDDWDDPAQSHSNAAWIDGVTFTEGL